MAIDIEASYRRYGPMVLRRCRALLGNDQQAQELMQDTFVQMLRNQERLEDRGLSSLLYRIATNLCLNKIRSQGRKPESPVGDLLWQIASDENLSERSSARVLLGRLFAKEQASTQVIAVLHLVDGMTHAEVADTVGLSVSGVRKRLRGLKARAQTLQGEPA